MKDVKISSTELIRNVVQKVERTNRDGTTFWANTHNYDQDVYDLAVDLQSMSGTGKREFWQNNHVEIEVDVACLETPAGSSEIARLIIMMDRLGPEFCEHAQSVFVNLLLPEGETTYHPLPRQLKSTDPQGLEILEISTVAALQPLIEKFKEMMMTRLFVITLVDPSWTDETPTYDTLSHVVPFKGLDLY